MAAWWVVVLQQIWRAKLREGASDGVNWAEKDGAMVSSSLFCNRFHFSARSICSKQPLRTPWHLGFTQQVSYSCPKLCRPQVHSKSLCTGFKLGTTVGCGPTTEVLLLLWGLAFTSSLSARSARSSWISLLTCISGMTDLILLWKIQKYLFLRLPGNSGKMTD